ncbi:MAG: bacillithiol biosynthesis cysteine-adding enzyme BshC [Gemmatimonadetes bacterium]|nr:bacillithiol biosynthesis cysteine-adding enzyme BshC [Gemmatimonadota bacterium]
MRDYLSGVSDAVAFYRAPPLAAESFVAKAREIGRLSATERYAVAGDVVRPVGPAARELLARVIDQSGFFVTTGQQPGLFGGPLYSFYKALTAIRLARELRELLARPVMPLFWIASDDHDWAEASRIHLVDRGGKLREVSLGDSSTGVPRSLSRTLVGAAANDAVATVARAFGSNDFRDGYLRSIAEAYAPDATMAEAFGTFMAELLGQTELGLIEADDRRLKRASAPLLSAEADDPEASERALEGTARRLKENRYRLQVPQIPGASLLMVELEEGRERLQAVRGDFSLRRSGRRLSRRSLGSLIESRPEVVSPNVLLRPIVESYLFPNLAYVGGPGELAYLGQLEGLFERHGTARPIAFPRASLMVVEAKVERVLEMCGIEPDELRDASAMIGKLTRARLPAEIVNALARWRGAVEEQGAELADAVESLDPTLAGAVARARGAGVGAADALEKKIARAARRLDETTEARIRRAHAHLWPLNRAQDRVLGPLQYLMLYGPTFVDRALEAISIDLNGEGSR